MSTSNGSNGGGDGHSLKAAFQRFMADPENEITEATNPVQDLLDAHFSADSRELPTTAVRYEFYEQVAYQRALSEYLSEPGRKHEMTGLRCPSIPDYRMGEMSFARLLSKPTFVFVPPVFCPPDYGVVPCGIDETIPCLRLGLMLVEDADGRAALWLRLDGHNSQMVLEVMTSTPEHGATILDRLAKRAVHFSPYHGQVIEILPGPTLRFVDRPRDTRRDEVILPAGLLDQIERHSLGAVSAQEALKNSKQHLKRGLLLHGRPGTGKTHTIKYLISQMPDATVAVMSAARMNFVGLLRQLIDVIVPGVIILDDVDLIAEDRTFAGARYQLFELLDVLDGINEDSDLLFVMTTNRPNEIEPAIAARPGRVDQAIEVPLPDDDCRRRLFDLYCEGLDVNMSTAEMTEFLNRTDGVTASFIREVLRRAAVAALDIDGDGKVPSIKVSGRQVLTALDELLDPANPLTPLLLGGTPKHALPTIKL